MDAERDQPSARVASSSALNLRRRGDDLRAASAQTLPRHGRSGALLGQGQLRRRLHHFLVRNGDVADSSFRDRFKGRRRRYHRRFQRRNRMGSSGGDFR